MATIADLWVTLGLKSDGFSKGIRSAENEVDSFVSKMAAAGQKMVGIGKGMSLAITTPIAIGAKFAIGEASDLAEAQSAVATVYGDAAKDIHGATGSVAKDLGLSRSEALQAATGFGVFAKGAGLSGDAAVGFSNDLVGASADLASFYNTSSPEVLEAIQSGLTGETEPLRKFGILLNEASLQEYALANGIWDGSTAMTEQQKVLARQGFIMENLGDAQGDFARTQDSMANRFKIMQKRVKDFAGVLGTAMMPAVEKVMGWLEKFASALEGLSPTMLKWGVIILGVVAAIGPLLIVLGYFLQALAPLGAAFALILSPIGLLIAAIGLLAFAFRGPIFSAIGEVVDRLREFVSDITKVYDRLRQGALVYDEFNDRWVRMGHGASVASALIRAFGSALEDLLGLELSAFFFNIADAVDVFMSSFSAFRDAGANLPTALWMALGDAIGSLIGKDISAWFNDVAIAVGNIKDAAFDFDISALVSALGDLANLTVVPLGEWFLETVAPKVTGWLVTAAGNLWNHLKPLVGWTGDVLAELGAWLLSTAAPAVTGWLISAAGNLWNALKPLVGWTGDVLASLGEWTLDTAAPVVTGWLNAATTSTWNFIKRAAGWTWDNVADLGVVTMKIGGFALTTGLDAFGTWLADLNFRMMASAALHWATTPIELTPSFKLNLEAAAEAATRSALTVDFWVTALKVTAIGIAITAALLIGLATLPVTLPILLAVKIGPALIEGLWALFKGVFTGVTGKIGEFDWSGFITGIFDGIMGAANLTAQAFIGVGSAIAGAIQEALFLAAAAIDWANSGGILSKIYDSLSGAVGNIDWGAIPGQIVDSLWNAMKTAAGKLNPLDLFKGGGGDGFQTTPGGTPMPPKSGEAGSKGLDTANRFAAPDFSEFLQAHDTAFAAAADKLDAFAILSTNKGQLAADGFNNTFILDPAVAHAGAVQGSLESIFSGIATDATNKGMVAGQGFNAGITQGTNQAVSQAGAAQASLAAIGNGVAASLTVAGFNAGSGFAAGIWAGMSEAVAAAGAAANGIRGAVSFDLYNQGYSIGSSLGLGVSRGILDTIQAAVNAAASLVNATVTAGRGAGGIASPSKVMAKMVGLPLAQGVALGIRQGAREVDRAALGLVPSLRPNSVPGLSDYGAGAGSGGIHVSLTVQGDVYDGDGFEDRVVNVVVDKVVPAVAAAAQQRDRAIGVRR